MKKEKRKRGKGRRAANRHNQKNPFERGYGGVNTAANCKIYPTPVAE